MSSMQSPIFHIHIVGIDFYWQIIEPSDECYPAFVDAHGLILDCNEERYSETSVKAVRELAVSKMFPMTSAKFTILPARIVVTNAGV